MLSVSNGGFTEAEEEAGPSQTKLSLLKQKSELLPSQGGSPSATEEEVFLCAEGIAGYHFFSPYIAG